MAKQHINIGDSVNDKRGDPLRTAFGKVNDNFTELYTLTGGASAALTELAQDYAALLFTHADNVGISFSYNDITNKLIATVANQLPAQANNGGKYLTTNGTTASWATVSSVTTSATAPTSPALGDLWYDTESGRTYVYYDSTWVDSSPVDGNPDLGDWAFRNDLMYSLNGGVIENSDLTHGATAALTIPTNGSNSPIVLTNAYGNVALVSGASPGALKTWSFGTEGKLTLPAGTTYAYLDAPLTGHGDGLARLDFTLVTDGVNTQWAAASANPAGSGYNIGDTFTFDAEFLGIPGASVTIEVLTVGVGGSVENLAFTQPPLYPADIYRDSPINLQVGPESNRWTFGATGKLTTPGDIQLGTDSYLRFPDNSFQGTAFVGIATTAEGLSNTSNATVVVGPLGDNKTWTFGTDGALTFPDNLTVVNGIIGKASTATITEGEASQTTAIESQIEITTTGVVIAKRTSVTVNDGVITTVNDSGSKLELDNTHASITYYIEPDGPNNNSLIQFTTDSSAGGGATIETVTEDVGGTAHGRVRAAGNSVQVSTKTFLGTNKTWSFTGAGNLQLPESGNILSNGANYIDLANFETSYNDAEGAYQDALTAWMTLEMFKPVWFALPGRLAYNEMIAWIPTAGQPTLPPNLPPVAKNAQDSYAVWQETIALSKLTVASDIAEFDFNSTGKLRLSQGGTVGGGDQAAIDTAYDDWQADEAAWQNLITTDGADLNVRPWNFAGPSRAEKQAVVLSMWQAQQSGAAIDWVPISSTFYNQVNAWLAITANQDGYDEWKKLTTTVNITSEDKTWTFTNDGALTLPDASVIASYKPVTVIAATTTAQTITDNASAAFIQFVETVDTAGAFSPGTFTAPYTGYYQINMSVYFPTTVTLNSGSFLLIDTNLDSNKQVRIIDGNWTGSYLHYSTVISATAGDAIRVAFRQVSGGDIDVSSGSRLTIHRVSIS